MNEKAWRAFELNFEANEKQQLAISLLMQDPDIRELGYGGWAGWGKSYLGVFWQWCMRINYPGTRGFFGRRELKALKRTTLATYFKFCADYKIPESLRGKYNAQDSLIRYDNGSEIYLLDLAYLPSDPMYERFGSLEFTDGFVDESGEVEAKCIEILTTRVGRQRNEDYSIAPKILESFNPNKGHIYTRYFKPHKEGTLPKYRKFIPALATDNPKLPRSYIESLERASEVTKQRLLYGNFEYDDRPNKLIDYDDILDSYTNAWEMWEAYISVDVAGEGADNAVICVWNGYTLIDYRKIAKCDPQELQDAVRWLAASYRVGMSNTVGDQDGIGWGIVGNLKCKGFSNGSSPIDTRREHEKKQQGGKPLYQNLKTQCYYLLRDAMRDKKLNLSILDPRDQELLNEELDIIEEINADKDGPRRITPKEDIKRVLGRSPDLSDAVMMRMYFELNPKKKTVAFAV